METKTNGRTNRTRCKLYTQFQLELLYADKAIIKATGEVVNLTETFKVIYIYMRNMYCLSLDSSKSGGYFESWESIAATIGKDVALFKKGANRPDIIMEKLGLLIQDGRTKGRASVKTVLDITDITDKVEFINEKKDLFKSIKSKQRDDFLSEKDGENCSGYYGEQLECPTYEIPLEAYTETTDCYESDMDISVFDIPY